MQIILDDYPIPEQGQIDINLHFSFKLNIDSAEARKVVNSWLLNEVSYLVGAGNPTLVLSKEPTWRVPIWISFHGMSQKKFVGVVDVDVQTGKIIDAEKTKDKLEGFLEESIKPILPQDEFVVRELPQRFKN